MITEELFTQGVTLKKGPGAGKRFRVLAIRPGELTVADWDDPSDRGTVKDGEYEIWTSPKNVFEDHSLKVTLGSLKKAAEEIGLKDETPIYVTGFCPFDRMISPAQVDVATVNGKKAIIVG